MDKRSLICIFLSLLSSIFGQCAFAQTGWIQSLKEGKDLQIIVYGTSLTAGEPAAGWVMGLQDSLNARFVGTATIKNMAQVAMHSNWGVANLEDSVLRHSPDVVFLEFAINDAYLPYGISLELSKLNAKYMIKRIRMQCPESEIVLQVMNPPVGDHLLVRPEIEKYYDECIKVGKQLGVKVIDHRKYWKEIVRDSSLYRQWVPDGLHPSFEANRELVLAYILKSLDM